MEGKREEEISLKSERQIQEIDITHLFNKFVEVPKDGVNFFEDGRYSLLHKSTVSLQLHAEGRALHKYILSLKANSSQSIGF